MWKLSNVEFVLQGGAISHLEMAQQKKSKKKLYSKGYCANAKNYKIPPPRITSTLIMFY